MDNVRQETPQENVQITDLRDVPLDQLSADGAAADLVATMMHRMKGASRVSVSGFGSSI